MREILESLYKQASTEIRSFYKDLIRFDVLRHSYAMAYVSLLSLIPSLAAIFAVLSLFNPLLDQDSNLMNQVKTFVLEHLAAASGEQAIEYMESFLSNLDIKKIGISGFAGTLVTLVLLLKHIEVALNRIFQVHKPRPLITRFVNFWTFLTLGSFSTALFVGTLSSYTTTGGLEGFGAHVSTMANKFVMILLFTLIYKLVPNCYVNSLWAFLGGVLSTILLTLSGSLLKSYIVLFSNYQAIYGAALAALPIFLLWLYLIWLIILLGALFAWRMQNREQRLNEELNANLTPTSVYAQSNLKVELPFLVLEMCFEAFSDSTGKGLPIRKIYGDLQIPTAWIDESIELLKEKDLVIVDRDSPEDPALFPKRPEKTVTTANLKVLLEDEGVTPSDEHLRIREKLKL